MQRHRFHLSLVAAAILAASTLLLAQAPPKGPIAHFAATTTNISNADESVTVDLLRWSTDEERDRMVSVLAWYGERELPGALPTIGYLWTTESAGYSVRYAYRIPAADGSERVILLTDRRLGGSPQAWKPATAAVVPDYPFTLVELRLNGAGQGEGKATITNKLTVDAAAKTIALEDYSTAPVLLKSVSRTSK